MDIARWTFALALALPLAGCPDSGREADDDDLTAGDDDDDDTIPGDDDTTPGDDDDDDDDDTTTGPCSSVGEGGPGFDAYGASQAGDWIAGQLHWDGEFLSVAPDFGPAFALRIWYGPDVDMDALMDGITGPGRLFRQAGASGAWTTHGVAAVATDDGAHAVVIGSSGVPGAGLDAIGFQLRVDPLFDACSEPLVDMNGCGLGAALPMAVSLDGETAEVWPGTAQPFDGYTFQLHQGWQVFEILCDDFDSPGFSWVLRRVE